MDASVLTFTNVSAAVSASRFQPDSHVKLTYQVELITPMVGGGVLAGKVDQDLPFRTRSLRGQLRHWWRIATRTLAADPKSALRSFVNADAAAWRDLEQKRWGGLGNPPIASAIGLRIAAATKRPPNISFAQATQESKGLAYAYFSVEGKQGAIVNSGAKFTLTVFCPAELQAEVQLTVRFWATFGGLGARTSRGAGAVKVTQAAANGKPSTLVSLFDATSIPGGQPGSTGYVAQKFGGAPLQAWLVGPIAGSTFPDARAAHRRALIRLWEFRQSVGFARKANQMSLWPEAASARHQAGVQQQGHQPKDDIANKQSAPRAAFGLPIVLFFKDGPGEKATADVKNKDPATRIIGPADINRDRMASPLILRPIAIDTPNGPRYLAAAVLMNRALLENQVHGAGLPTQVRMSIQGTSAATTDPLLDVTLAGLPTELQVHDKGPVFNPPANAVEMFINYWAATAK